MSGMKVKTIKSVLRKKFDSFLVNIEDENLRAQVASNAIITGGAIASMLLGEPINDFDLYLRNHETALALAKYYLARFKPKNARGIPCEIFIDDSPSRIRVVVKSSGIASENGAEAAYQYFEGCPDESASSEYISQVMTDPGDIEEALQEAEQQALAAKDSDSRPKFRPVFISTNAITLSEKMQIILRFFGEPGEIQENYDFVHCTNYWTSWDNELVLRPAALQALLSKELCYCGSKYPVCSIIRVRKFLSRGWRINAGQLLKIIMQVSDLDLHNIDVLQDQLTGVDAAYFAQLMQRLREKDSQKIETAYLVEIIDRSF